LVHTPYFTSNYLNIEGALENYYSGSDSFIIYICISGSLTLIENEISYSLVQGETILIPASIHKINVHAASNAEILEVYY
jgi:mannose-6-phosphate isomerase